MNNLKNLRNADVSACIIDELVDLQDIEINRKFPINRRQLILLRRLAILIFLGLMILLSKSNSATEKIFRKYSQMLFLQDKFTD